MSLNKYFLVLVFFSCLGIDAFQQKQYIVKFKDAPEAKLLNQFNSDQFVIIERLSAKRGIYLVESEKGVRNKASLSMQLSRLGKVVHLEENRKIHLDLFSSRSFSAMSDSSKSIEQWNTTCNFGICAEPVWEKHSGSKDIRVAIIDTGIDLAHENLKANIWINRKEQEGEPNKDDDGNGYVDDVNGFDVRLMTPTITDVHGHGTHVAGIIGATHNNVTGIKGINKEVSLISVSAFNKEGKATSADLIKAYEYVLSVGVDVVNMSYGSISYSPIEEEYMREMIESGIVLVASSGNSGISVLPHFPSGYALEGLISVGSIDSDGEMSGFSNYSGTRVDLFAPGGEIWSTFPGNKYESLSGTSMAGPQVAGSVALLRSVYRDIDPTEIYQLVTQSVNKVAKLKAKCRSGGTLNLDRLIKKESNPKDMNYPDNWPHVPKLIETSHPYSYGEFEWEVTVEGAKEISLYFDEFNLEFGFDMLEVFDINNERVFQLTGEHLWTRSYSPIIKGNYAKLRLISDESFNYYGFKVSKIAYR